jgi:hypothetical protein
MNMAQDPRCCGSGTCIINAEGECWCGQKWDGTKMCQPYYINESGSRVNAVTGELVQAYELGSQCLPP